MRTSKATACLIILLLYLSCLVQQCQPFMFQLLASTLGNAVSSSLTLTSAIGMSVGQSIMHSFISTFQHGFSTLHTMTMSLISGFIIGNMFLVAFIFVLFALVPAEEFRSLDGPSVFAQVRHRHLLPYYPAHLDNSTVLDFVENNSTLAARTKRSVHSLVSHKNASSLSFTLPSSPLAPTLPTGNASHNSQFQYNIRFAVDDDANNNATVEDPLALNGTDKRIPRFLTRLVQRDPFNCLPLLLCGLSAARKPSERTEVLNDYAYLLKEFMEPEDDRSEEGSRSDEEEDELVALGKGTKSRYRQTPVNLLNELVNAVGKKKDKDEVDKIIEQMRKEEDDKVEDLVLTEMADNPNDLTFALEDMKLRGLKKTVSKMPYDSKKKYISTLIKDDSGEDGDGEVYGDGDYDMPMSMMGHHPRHEYPDSSNEYHYDTRNLVRGRFPPAPPEPPVPEYGVEDDTLYKKNLKILEDTLNNGPPPFHRRWVPEGPHPQLPPRRRYKRNMDGRNRPPPPRGFLQKKRGEAAEADNLFDMARVGAEVGAVTRNNRQCRSLFRECPISSLIKPPAGDEGPPFLNRAVNNLRRVLLGTPPEYSKTRRVNEIKEVINQLHPQRNHGGSEVRVVLNIGPSPQPFDLHRAGGSPPPPQYDTQLLSHSISQSGLPAPFSTKPVPMQDSYSHEYTSYKNPSPHTTTRPRPSTASLTTPKPGSATTRKTMNYHKPSLPPPIPTKSLMDLEKLLKATQASINSGEVATTNMPGDETTLNVFTDVDSGESGEMEDEPVFPTQYPISKDEYAQNLRETFDIFQKFKEANKGSGTGLTTVRPRSSTTKKAAVLQNSGSKTNPKKKVPGLPGQEDLPEKDFDHEHDENDVQGVLKIIKKFREKYLPKKKKRRKKKKKKKPNHSSEESSEEDPHDHYIPTLVAVPSPEVRKQINWRSGTTAIKDGVYHLLFGRRQVKPLPEHPIHHHHHPSGEDHYGGPKPIRHDHNGHFPPPLLHHPHRLRTSDSSESAQDGEPAAPTLLPTSTTPSSATKSSATSKAKVSKKKKKVAKPTSKPKQKQPIIITQRPIKIKLKTPKPIILPESMEDEEEEEEDDMPPPPGYPPPPFRSFDHLRSAEDFSGSYEEYGDGENSDYPVGLTKPQLMYTPFAHTNLRTSPSPSNSKKKNKAKKGTGAASPSSARSLTRRTYKITSSKKKKTSSSSTTARTTTTVKPKRKIIKYKNG